MATHGEKTTQPEGRDNAVLVKTYRSGVSLWKWVLGYCYQQHGALLRPVNVVWELRTADGRVIDQALKKRVLLEEWKLV
jgi:hypothetical protein